MTAVTAYGGIGMEYQAEADPIAIAIARLRQVSEYSDPVVWAHDKLGIDLYSVQERICRAVQEHDRTAVRSSHEIGKSFVAAVLACWWIDTHPIGSAFVVTTAPSRAQLVTVLWREINRIFKLAERRAKDGLIKAALPGRMNQTEWWIGNEIVGQGRKPADWDTDAFQGIHAEYVLAIIDEANGVPKPMWTGVEGVTSNDTSKVLAVGNPDDPESEFARVSGVGKVNSIWFSFKISAFDTPAWTGEKVHPKLLRVLVGKKWVADREEDWGKDSALYVSRVLGEFPDIENVKSKIVPITALIACLDEPEPAQAKKLRRTPVVLGMDVAAGGDETVLRERRGAFAGRSWNAKTPDGQDAVDLAIKAVVESGATRIHVDEIGWGWGIVTAINQALRAKKIRCSAYGINVSRKASRPDLFVNLRAELWWMARDLTKQGGWVLHGMEHQEATVSQLTDPHWATATGGRIKVEEKAETIKRLGRSPDDADALILAYAHPAKSGGQATVSRPGAAGKGGVRSGKTRTASAANRGARRRGSLVTQRTR